MCRGILAIGLAGLFVLGCIQVAFSVSANNIEDFDQAAEKIQVVIEDEAATVDWVSISQAIQRIGIIKDPRAKELMVGILHREVPLALVEGVPLPDVMPPLQMLKAAAIDVLVSLNAKECISEIQKVYETTQFKVLKDMAMEAIVILQE